MGGGGSSNNDQTSQVRPPEFAMPMLNQVADQTMEQSGDVQQFYPGQTYAGMDPYQLQAQDMNINAANMFQNEFGNTVVPGFQNLLGAADPTNDPVVQRQLQTIEQRGQQNLQDSLGSIADSSIGAGQLGGSRRGIAEGLAASRATTGIANAQSDLLGRARGQGLEAAARGLAFAPNVATLGQFPGQVYGQVGAQNQALAQQGINEDMARFNFEQAAPGMALDQDIARASQLAGFGGTTTVSGLGDGGTSSLQGAMAGGLGTAGLISQFGMPTALGFTPPGALIAGGALAGGLLL